VSLARPDPPASIMDVEVPGSSVREKKSDPPAAANGLQGQALALLPFQGPPAANMLAASNIAVATQGQMLALLPHAGTLQTALAAATPNFLTQEKMPPHRKIVRVKNTRLSKSPRAKVNLKSPPLTFEEDIDAPPPADDTAPTVKAAEDKKQHMSSLERALVVALADKEGWDFENSDPPDLDLFEDVPLNPPTSASGDTTGHDIPDREYTSTQKWRRLLTKKRVMEE
jgi:hypothetical protein